MGNATQTRTTERRTAAEEVYRALKRDIITLQHEPGTSLTEKKLATLYGTSRVPVREACKRLDQEGLLTGRPYRGYSVNRISLKEIGDCFDAGFPERRCPAPLEVFDRVDGELGQLGEGSAAHSTEIR